MTIPNKRELLEYILQYPQHPKTSSQLRGIFGISAKNKLSFKNVLKSLINDGKLIRNQHKQIIASPELLVAVQNAKKKHPHQPISLNVDAVKTEPERKSLAPLKGKPLRKPVIVDLAPESAIPETPLNKVFQKNRAPQLLKGKVIKRQSQWYVAQEDQISKTYRLSYSPKDLRIGQLVFFEVLPGKANTAKIVARQEQDTSFEKVCLEFHSRFNLPPVFPQPCLDQALACSAPEDDEISKREDFRNIQTICIDPLGAKDHDDAISLVKNTDGTWTMGVHIADVSHYVTELSPLDREAQSRSFTQYLPWTAVPMLPHELSTDLCSLKQGKDRLAFSCIIELSARGIVKDFRFAKTVINVDEFVTYEVAFERMNQGEQAFIQLAKITRLLRGRREKHGMLELNIPENKVVFNENKEPVGLKVHQYVESQSWIEECMLLANQCCATFCKEHKLAAVFREHEPPAIEDISELIFKEPNLAIGAPFVLDQLQKGRKANSNMDMKTFAFYKKMLENTNGDDNLVRKILRSMQKARYGTEGKGHFALCWENYAHFTSPIRRYADLWVHRRMTYFLAKQKEKNGVEDEAVAVSELISENELKIMKCERQSLKVCAAWIAKDQVGEVFVGRISGMEEFGFFVFIPELSIEGLLRYADIPGDYYQFYPEQDAVVGRRSKKVFRRDQALEVQIQRVNVVKGEVDLRWTGNEKVNLS